MSRQTTLQPVSWTPEERENASAFMKRARIVESKLVPWGSNYTFATVLEDPREEFANMVGITSMFSILRLSPMQLFLSKAIAAQTFTILLHIL